MARIISGTCGRDVYVEVLENLRRRGVRRQSRNGPTYNLDDVTIELESPLNVLPVGVGRNLNPRIAAAEALQLIGGFSDPKWMVEIAPRFRNYLESNGRFHGAYGERITIGRQLANVVAKLKLEPYTRQAVITLWHPQLDNEGGKLDYPCTVALGFSRSNLDRLDMRVAMRSNDAWLGVPYDMFQFTQLQLTLCNVLNVLPGTYTHTAWSMHLYHEHVDESYGVAETSIVPDQLSHVRGLGRIGVDSLDQVLGRAYFIRYRDVTSAKLPADDAESLKWHPISAAELELTESEKWYLDTLHAG